MKTLRLKLDPEQADGPEVSAAIEKAAAILRGGGLVAFPTETVYGLGANALSPQAVGRIFEAKKRPGWDPLIVHVSNRSMLARIVAEIPRKAELLISSFWPGALTLLLPKTSEIPEAVTAGRRLVGVRMPANAVARHLIAASGVPVAAPSANLFGRPSPTAAAHVLEDLDGRIDAILDAGTTEYGVESTVIDVSESPAIVYRPGAISLEQIRELCPAELWSGIQEPTTRVESLPSPGVGIRHYAPRAKLVLLEDTGEISRMLDLLGKSEMRIGIMMPRGVLTEHPMLMSQRVKVFDWGVWDCQEELAHRLFSALRELDSDGVDVIVCPLPQAVGLGVAIRDRLLKAARPK